MRKTKEEKIFELLGKITAMILFSSFFAMIILYGIMNATTLN